LQITDAIADCVPTATANAVANGHRTSTPHGTTRHCQSPLPALAGLFITVSKRDPNPSFNPQY